MECPAQRGLWPAQLRGHRFCHHTARRPMEGCSHARLMAAAPDLVLVVDKLLSFALGLGYSAVDEFQVMTEEARSALAKARGE